MSQSPSTSTQGSATTSDTDYAIPLDFVKERIKIVADDLTVEEGGLIVLSTACEFFMRLLIQEGSMNGTAEINYDSISNVINTSNFEALKDFFPTRIPYREVVATRTKLSPPTNAPESSGALEPPPRNTD